ncbi:hypothetical protein [Variovorax sp. JS1663]|nr:hypothetical protein [Variovorax sp. JS1663]
METIDGADHALSHPDWDAAFRRLLFDWLVPLGAGAHAALAGRQA